MIRAAVPRHSDPASVPPSTTWRERFPEGLTFVWLAVGFVLCRFLTDTFLPHLGLAQLAHDYESTVNRIAPYLELPLCAVLCLQLLRRSLAPGLLGIAGALALDYFFFVHFVESASWLALGLIGLAVLWSYLLARRRRGRQGAVGADFFPLRLRLACGVAYLVGIGVALLLKFGLEQAAFGGRLGEDAPSAVPLVATLLAVAVYLLLPGQDGTRRPHREAFLND